MSWNAPTHAELLAMMDGNPPPPFPADKDAQAKISDDQALAMYHYWRVYDARLEPTFNKGEAMRYRLLAGVVPAPWWDYHREFEIWFYHSGAAKRLGLYAEEA